MDQWDALYFAYSHIICDNRAMAYNPNHLTERDIRDALLRRLLQSTPASGVLIEELGVGPARVDVAAAGELLSGYEIKSDYDTLDRLARQMHAYHEVFDLLTIVTTETYVDQVEALLPKWWGILVAARQPDGVVLTERRPSMPHNRQIPEALAAMLWRDDAYEFALGLLGPVVKARATRGDLQEIIAKHIPLEIIRQKVLNSLIGRQDLKARSHSPTQNRANRERKVVVRRIPAPSHEIAGW